MNEISYIFFGVSQFGKRSFIFLQILKKTYISLRFERPAACVKRSIMPGCVCQHASMCQRATIGTHFAAQPTCNDWHAFCGPANVQVLSLARILRPSRSVSISHSSGTPAVTQACLSRLIRRPVRLWLRFRSDRRYPQKAAFPWIPCL